MRRTGASLAFSLYQKPCTIVLSGELGAGKTTFTQGLAEGLGLQQKITSPTYALEQQYGGVLSHIDLYRLNPAQTKKFVEELEPFPGIRVIEWGERSKDIDGSIHIDIQETDSGRKLDFRFSDMPLPTETEIKAWYKETMIPAHIVKHMQAVARASAMVADELVAQGRVIRKESVIAAALVHDILRFVDFKSPVGHEDFKASEKELSTWKALKEKYGVPHESAAQKFIAEKGYAGLGEIVRTHRGYSETDSDMPKTIEQMVLAYADKRTKFDALATVDERFDDLTKRYRDGLETPYSMAWRKETKRIEKVLFPEGVPF
jgi:tRNA threonylcarbamoyladenosine biosynthesis protein TsaE